LLQLERPEALASSRIAATVSARALFSIFRTAASLTPSSSAMAWSRHPWRRSSSARRCRSRATSARGPVWN